MPEPRVIYQILEHKSDTGFMVTAPSWERLYIDAALALTDTMVKLDHIQEKEKKTLSLTSDNKESLMVEWLNEILFLFERHRFLSRRILFSGFDGKSIEATLWGELYTPAHHGHFSEIKAVTYHQLELGEQNAPESQFFARIFLDL